MVKSDDDEGGRRRGSMLRGWDSRVVEWTVGTDTLVKYSLSSKSVKGVSENPDASIITKCYDTGSVSFL